MFTIPSYAQTVLAVLEKNGFEAYIVGGCVRDSLLALAPADYDITTNALPEQVLAAFSGYHTIETGLKHGTVTVVIEKSPVEITTYRIDGDYSDNRRPDSVTYTADIKDDLSRRDFTINAMAYNDVTGLVDCFGGSSDLANRLVRCVGDADIRFSEDALRILRALRFAAVLGFDIEKETEKSIHKNRLLLKNIASERIFSEFSKLICAEEPARIIDQFRDVFAVFMPEIAPMFGFEQHSKYHDSDVWHHSLRALSAVFQKSFPLRLAALLHDIGKPCCFEEDESGEGHFYGHAEQSEAITRNILNRLRCDNASKNAVLMLISYHDASIAPSKKSIKRFLGKLGEDLFFDLIELKKADSAAHAAPYTTVRIEALERVRCLAREVLDEGSCFKLKDLSIDGHDIMSLGLKGTQIGAALKYLLEMVIEGTLKNEKDALVCAAREWINKKETE